MFAISILDDYYLNTPHMRETKMSEKIEKSAMAMRIDSRMKDLNIANYGRLSAKAGVSRAVLTNLMRRPDKQLWAVVALKISQGLECRLEWLITGDGPITDTPQKEFERLYGKSPLVELNELNIKNFTEFVNVACHEPHRPKYHCPKLSSVDTVVVRANRKLGRFDEDALLFIDLNNKTPQNGQIVLVRAATGGVPEFYVFSSAINKKFLRSMSQDLPEELRLIEMDETIEVVGCFVAAIISA